MSFQTFEILDNNRGLILPPKKTNVSAIPTRREDLLALINENNYDPSEEFYQKTSQAKAQLVAADRVDSYMDEAKSEFVNINLDPSIYTDLESDAKRRKDNYMNAESQDFVGMIQQSVQSFNMEQNLYGQPPQQLGDLTKLLQQALSGDKATITERVVSKLQADQNAKIKESIARRRREVPSFRDEL